VFEPEFHGQPTSLFYIDLCLAEIGERIQLSEELRLDLLLGLARRFGHQVDHGVSILNRPFVHTDGSFFYGCGQTDFQIEGSSPTP